MILVFEIKITLFYELKIKENVLSRSHDCNFYHCWM